MGGGWALLNLTQHCPSHALCQPRSLPCPARLPPIPYSLAALTRARGAARTAHPWHAAVPAAIGAQLSVRGSGGKRGGLGGAAGRRRAVLQWRMLSKHSIAFGCCSGPSRTSPVMAAVSRGAHLLPHSALPAPHRSWLWSLTDCVSTAGRQRLLREGGHSGFVSVAGVVGNVGWQPCMRLPTSARMVSMGAVCPALVYTCAAKPLGKAALLCRAPNLLLPSLSPGPFPCRWWCSWRTHASRWWPCMRCWRCASVRAACCGCWPCRLAGAPACTSCGPLQRCSCIRSCAAQACAPSPSGLEPSACPRGPQGARPLWWRCAPRTTHAPGTAFAACCSASAPSTRCPTAPHCTGELAGSHGINHPAVGCWQHCSTHLPAGKRHALQPLSHLLSVCSRLSQPSSGCMLR